MSGKSDVSGKGTDTNDQRVIDLLQQLVSIPSVSGQEKAASEYLVGWMKEESFDRSYVDDAGNAIGEKGAADAKHTVVLLGHIDTVPGDIPVRIETATTADAPDGEPVLYGRGSVDAKGPLVTFAEAVARIDSSLLHQHDIRLVVAGAVEEESATSKGARFLARRFNGVHESRPAACIIGEPSRWHRFTLGYKGRLLVDLSAQRELTHTAGPDPGVAVVAIDFWQEILRFADSFNRGREKAFEQFQPSVRSISSSCDDGFIESVTATFGLRLPLAFDLEQLEQAFVDFGQQRTGTEVSELDQNARTRSLNFDGDQLDLRLHLRGHEQAWKGERSSVLARCFLRAIRQEDPSIRPGFVVKTGTSDMNVVAPVWQCPILAYGPGDSMLDHTPGEHQPLAELARAASVLENALNHLIESSDSLCPAS